MRQVLVPGKPLDIVTAEELESAIAVLAENLRGDQRTMRPDGQGQTDGTGALTVVLYTIPIGYEFALHRLLVDAANATPGAPFNAPAGYIDILRGDERVDFLPLAAGQGAIPAVFTAGDSDAARFRNGEQCIVKIVAGPASTGIIVRGQGTLNPVTEE